MSRSILRLDTLGSFDFQTNLISLNSLKAAQIERAMSLMLENPRDVESFEILQPVLPLVAHEYTHYIDATASLWGFKHQSLLNSAYTSTAGREDDYWKMKRFYDHCRSIRLPSYYTVVSPASVPVQTWKYETSIGLTFEGSGRLSGRPVAFCRFSTLTNALLARSPLSAVSVLEASAMAQEFLANLHLLAALDPISSRIELARTNEKLRATLYNHKFTEYCVCAHILANRQKMSSPSSAFMGVALITRLALNFPERAYKRMANAKGIDALFGRDPPSKFVERVRTALKHRDVGVLFLVLCHALDADCLGSVGDANQAIATALKKFGMSLQDILGWASEEIRPLHAELLRSKIESIALTARSAMENWVALNWTSSYINFSELDLPPAECDDSEAVSILGRDGAIGAYSTLAQHAALTTARDKVLNFVEGCL